MTKQKLPRATHEGKIGNVDCYVLDDGRCVLAGGQATAAIVGLKPNNETPGLAIFERYVANLAKKTGHLIAVHSFEFVTPSGQIAKGIVDETFSDVCQAYTDGLVAGSVTGKTIAVAQRAYALQKTWAKIGLRAHILAVTGASAKTAMGEIRSLADKLFRKDPREFEVLYNTELVDAIRRLYGHPRGKHESRRIPQWMAAFFGKLYRKFLGRDGYVLLKKRNPYPSQKTALHHQWLVEAILVEIKDHRAAIVYIANRSGHSKRYFWEQIDELLGIGKQQLLPAA